MNLKSLLFGSLALGYDSAGHQLDLFCSPNPAWYTAQARLIFAERKIVPDLHPLLKAKLTLPKRADIGRTSLEFSECPRCAKHYSKMLIEGHKMAREGPFPREACCLMGKQICGQQTGIRAVMGYNQSAIGVMDFHVGRRGVGIIREAFRLGLQLGFDEKHLNKEEGAKALLSLLCPLLCSRPLLCVTKAPLSTHLVGPCNVQEGDD